MTSRSFSSGMLMGLTKEGLSNLIKELEEELKQEQGDKDE